MRVRVRAFAVFREMIGAGEVTLELDGGSSVRDVLEKLCGIYGIYDKLFDASGNLRDYVHVLKNGKHINFIGGLDAEVRDGDEIAIFPPAAGG
ncbi:MAG: ubiquitin-like small modifier protein 1 [Candidatus Alkanophagales archaeon]